MRVLHLTPELAPWSKSGGLGDAAAALAKAIALRGHEVRVLSPLHGSIHGRAEFAVHREQLTVGVIPADACRIRRAPGTHAYLPLFLEHEAFFGGTEIYGQPATAAKRFAFLTRAGLDLCLADGWIPDVIHCHDWTVALAPVLLNTVLRDSPLATAATVLTLHNLQHQGLHGKDIAPYLGLPDWVLTEDNLECLGGVNYLKGGLYHATRLTTVSPTYAREITEPAQGFGLDPVIRHRQPDLEGILNGVDADEWNPARDPLIPARFSATDLSGKATCKVGLQVDLGLEQDPGVPLVGVVARLWEQKGLDLALEPLRNRLRDGQIQLALLGSGDPALEQAYLALAKAHPGRAAVRIGYDNRLAHRIEAGADFFLMPSRFEPCGLNQLYSMAYGTLPIVRRTGGLADTVEPWTPGAPNATGIVFEHADRTGVAWALGEALRLRHDHPAEFTSMRVRAMTREFPWSRSAESYERCYLEAIRQRRQGFAKDTAEPAKPKPRPPVGSAKKPGKSVVSPKAKA